MLFLIAILGGLLIMMGQHSRSEALFYYFRLEDQIPETHVLRLIDKHISFSFVREKLKESYSDTGRPSIDPELLLAVFDVSTGRKLFEDSSMLDYYQKQLHIKNAFQITSGADQIIRLTYFRVVRAGCSLKSEPADCWSKVRDDFGIMQTDKPVCSRYEQANWESAIVYPVSVLLTTSPQIKAVDGPVFCWPTD